MELIKSKYKIRCELGGCRNIAEYSLIMDRAGIHSKIYICSHCAENIHKAIGDALYDGEKNNSVSSTVSECDTEIFRDEIVLDEVNGKILTSPEKSADKVVSLSDDTATETAETENEIEKEETKDENEIKTESKKEEIESANAEYAESKKENSVKKYAKKKDKSEEKA